MQNAASAPEAVDLFARWISGGSLVVAIISAWIAGIAVKNESWRRRYASFKKLEHDLKTLEEVCDPNASPQRAANLYATNVDLALAALDDRKNDIAYRKVRRKLEAVHSAITRARGTNQPKESDIQSGVGVTLTRRQKEQLTAAQKTFEELRLLREKMARKGSS